MAARIEADHVESLPVHLDQKLDIEPGIDRGARDEDQGRRCRPEGQDRQVDPEPVGLHPGVLHGAHVDGENQPGSFGERGDPGNGQAAGVPTVPQGEGPDDLDPGRRIRGGVPELPNQQDRV